jgi:hypothetical protein
MGAADLGSSKAPFGGLAAPGAGPAGGVIFTGIALCRAARGALLAFDSMPNDPRLLICTAECAAQF